ncbi:polysaccharide lyase family 1 protein [Erythrobacter sp. YT30]|uniref:pectate lyase family protein n=1 Tax=Erythrobacter sp. YT30 TaxID=1735012 RepID=UPI000B001320|nr:pectate lyase [Erythrobacter sp. YT30]
MTYQSVLKGKTALAAASAVALGLSACAEPVEAAPPPAAQPVSGKLAFPGAIGHGAGSKGGRGGKIIYVTTRKDSGKGSLRACLVAKGPRVCVFRVGGVFRFTNRPPVIKNPYLTIAGQTAPGGGVVISHAGGNSARTPLLIKNTNNIVVRHVRIRLDRLSANRKSDDAITIENSRKIVIDHVSASWASDELVNGYGDNDQITISNSIFAYGIPRHDKCALLASDPKDAQRVSFIGNICAHNGDRNPDINFPPQSCVEVMNNVLYNAESQFAEVWEQFGGTPVSIVGNTFVLGPNGSRNTQGIARNDIAAKGKAKIYLWDNDFVGNFDHVSSPARQRQVGNAPCAPTIKAKSAAKAYDDVLASAGTWPRDAIDAKVVSDIRNRAGQIISRPGSIGKIKSAKAYRDVDRDGMDDNWETKHGANPTVADTWGDANGDGFSNFDNFLIYRDGLKKKGKG